MKTYKDIYYKKNINLDNIVFSLTIDEYNSILESLAREFGLSSGPYKFKDCFLFNILKDNIKNKSDFNDFAKKKVTRDNIIIVLCCLIAGFKTSIIQDYTPHSSYTGKGSQTVSFNVDTGILGDRNNEWSKLAYHFMGINNPSRAKINFIEV